jgi:hypothetical protein
MKAWRAVNVIENGRPRLIEVFCTEEDFKLFCEAGRAKNLARQQQLVAQQ